MAEVGFSIRSRKRLLPENRRYLPKRMREEVILTLVKE